MKADGTEVVKLTVSDTASDNDPAWQPAQN
jgi:hypothetical protein